MHGPERLVRGLLGRHVGRRADRHPRRGQALRQRVVGARDPEVGDLDRAAAREQHVLRLEVAVRDALALRVSEPGEHALDDAADLRQLEPAHELAQRAARDVLHRDVGDAVVLEEVEQRDDVRVVERGRQPRLAHEALRERRVAALEIEPLEHDVAVERRLVHEVHDSHPAAGEHPDDLVVADAIRAQRISARHYVHRGTGARRSRARGPLGDDLHAHLLLGGGGAGVLDGEHGLHRRAGDRELVEVGLAGRSGAGAACRATSASAPSPCRGCGRPT